MGPYSEERQYQRAEAIQSLLENNPDIDPLYSICKFKPTTSIEDGIKKFVDWYKSFSNFSKN